MSKQERNRNASTLLGILLLSPLAKDIGADSLIEWKDEDERQYIRDSC